MTLTGGASLDLMTMTYSTPQFKVSMEPDVITQTIFRWKW